MKRPLCLTIWCLGLLCGATPALATTIEFAFDCEGSQVRGSIHYNVIGRYNASFGQCRGIVAYDPGNNEIMSVRVEIMTASISSNCGWCDKIVISPQLLDAERYPRIVYSSDSFTREDDGPWTRGEIDLHGVSRRLDSPFAFERIDGSDGSISLHVKGQWVINRKDFNIIWNRLLDRGGIIVGNEVTIDWQIVAREKGADRS